MKKILLLLTLCLVIFSGHVLPVNRVFAMSGYWTTTDEDSLTTQTQYINPSDCITNCVTDGDWFILQNGTTFEITPSHRTPNTTDWGGDNSGAAVVSYAKLGTSGGLHACLGTTNGGCELGSYDFIGTDPDNQNQEVLWFDPNSLNYIGETLYINYSGDGSYLMPTWANLETEYVFFWSFYANLNNWYDVPTPTPQPPTPTPTPFTQPESTASGSWCTYTLVTDNALVESDGFIFSNPFPAGYDVDEKTNVLLDFDVGLGFNKMNITQNVAFPEGLYPQTYFGIQYTTQNDHQVSQGMGGWITGNTTPYYTYSSWDWFGMSIYGTNHQKPTDVLVSLSMIDGSTLGCSNTQVVQESCGALDLICHVKNWIVDIKKWYEGLYTTFVGLFTIDPQYAINRYSSLATLTNTKIPWAYTNAVTSINLNNPEIATYDGTIPDFHFSGLSTKYYTGEQDEHNLQVLPAATISGSSFVNFDENVGTFRTIFAVLIWVLFSFTITELVLTIVHSL